MVLFIAYLVTRGGSLGPAPRRADLRYTRERASFPRFHSDVEAARRILTAVAAWLLASPQQPALKTSIDALYLQIDERPAATPVIVGRPVCTTLYVRRQSQLELKPSATWWQWLVAGILGSAGGVYLAVQLALGIPAMLHGLSGPGEAVAFIIIVIAGAIGGLAAIQELRRRQP